MNIQELSNLLFITAVYIIAEHIILFFICS